MLLKAVPLAMLALAFSAAGQDGPETPKPEEKKIPSLDTDRWLRGEFDRTQRKRNFVITPELKVLPRTRADSPGTKCSIPLLELKPQPNTRMKIFPPKGDGHIRLLQPPAPPCGQADRREPDPQPQPK